jgi:hypothetical protein
MQETNKSRRQCKIHEENFVFFLNLLVFNSCTDDGRETLYPTSRIIYEGCGGIEHENGFGNRSTGTISLPRALLLPG